MKELLFLAGNFFDFDLPKSKNYLFHYFRTGIEKQLIYYYYCLGNFEHFTDHTGLYCQQRWLKELKQRHDRLVEMLAKAKMEMDLDLVVLIESGKLKREKI